MRVPVRTDGFTFLLAEEASPSTDQRRAGDQLIPLKHQTRFKCLWRVEGGGGGDRGQKVICEIGK